MTLDTGLSPHTRRNPGEERAVLVPSRSISAHAEEPCSSRSASAAVRVYLRTRGGTDDAGLYGCCFRVYLRTRGGTRPHQNAARRGHGLSPHTRRNHPLPRVREGCRGSISAHAEEPVRPDCRYRLSRVYLRTRGGTSPEQSSLNKPLGLSPHTRRNQAKPQRRAAPPGSISAHAEEPRRRFRCRAAPRVYLRTRGGTHLFPDL